MTILLLVILLDNFRQGLRWQASFDSTCMFIDCITSDSKIDGGTIDNLPQDVV